MNSTALDRASTDRRISLPLFGLVLSLYVFLSPAHFLTTPDEELNLRTTLSLIEGYRGAIPPLPGGFATKLGIDGQEYAQYGLGLPLAAAPWCLLGRLIDPSADTAPNSIENLGPDSAAGTLFLRGWMSLFTVLLTAFTVVVFERILRALGLSRSSSLFFSLLYAFGAYTWPHGRTFFTEPAVAFCLLAAVACLFYARERNFPGRWVLYAGVFWAYAVLTRLDTLVTLPAAAWLLLIRLDGDEFRLDLHPRRLISFALPFLAVFAFIALYNQYRFDSFVSTGYEDQAEKINFATPLPVGLHGFLLSPGRSIFVYSPPLIFLFLGIPRLWRRDRVLCGGILLLCGFFLSVMSMWQNWAGGYDWGPRHIYQITPFLMLLSAAAFLDRPLFGTRSRRIGWAALVALSLFVQFLGLAADPVLVLKDLLHSWPQTEIAPGFTFSAVLMQFTIYLPHFSGPVLHWHAFLNHGPDLLLFRTPMLGTMLLPFAALAAFCGRVLLHGVRRAG